MSSRISVAVVVLCLHLANGSCFAEPPAENQLTVIRISPTDAKKGNHAIIEWNGLEVPETLQSTVLKRGFAKLGKGDHVLVIGDLRLCPQPFLSQLEAIEQASEQRQFTASYYTGRRTRAGNADTGNANVFWWVTPYELPGAHDQASYYYNHLSLGTGDRGFDLFLAIVRDDKPGMVIYSGSDYTYKVGYSDDEIPFRDREAELKAVLDAAGTTFRKASRGGLSSEIMERAELDAKGP